MVQTNLFLRGLKAHKRLCSNLRAPDQCPGVTESHPPPPESPLWEWVEHRRPRSCLWVAHTLPELGEASVLGTGEGHRMKPMLCSTIFPDRLSLLK